MRTIVVKVGSSTLTHAGGALNYRNLDRLSRVICDIAGGGTRVVLVSSGAQAAGVGVLGLEGKPDELRLRQACASVGQVVLMYTYEKMFGEYGRRIGQILLNRGDVDIAAHRANLENTFEALFEYCAVPIVNENDSVTTDELIIGDNDTLSAIVAELVRADTLILLSDVDGLYDTDPHRNANAKLIPVVRDVADVAHCTGGAGTSRGTGGMATKLSAAAFCMAHGIDTVIACGEDPTVLYDIIEGKSAGTLFTCK